MSLLLFSPSSGRPRWVRLPSSASRNVVVRLWYASSSPPGSQLVVGALGLDVTGLLALVADLLARRRTLGAVAREMARLSAVVAFAAVHTVAWDNLLARGRCLVYFFFSSGERERRRTRHVADTAARVARLVLVAEAAATAAAVRVVAGAAAVRSLGAVARNVADLAALRSVSAEVSRSSRALGP